MPVHRAGNGASACTYKEGRLPFKKVLATMAFASGQKFCLYIAGNSPNLPNGLFSVPRVSTIFYKGDACDAR